MPGLDAEAQGDPTGRPGRAREPVDPVAQGGQRSRPPDSQAIRRPGCDGRGGRADLAGDRQPGPLAGDRLHHAQLLGLDAGRVGHVRRGVRRAPPGRPGREFDVCRLGLRRGPLGIQASGHDHAGPARSRRRLADQRPQEALHADLFDGLPELRRERRGRGWNAPSRRRAGPGRFAGDRAAAVLEEPCPRRGGERRGDPHRCPCPR